VGRGVGELTGVSTFWRRTWWHRTPIFDVAATGPDRRGNRVGTST